MLPLPKIELPKGRELVIFAIDMISVIIGLLVAVYPFLAGMPFGGSEMTYHVAMGLMLFAFAFLRGNLPVGSAWVEIVNAAIGLFIALTPFFYYMTWNKGYTTGHVAAGVIVIAASILSAVLTPKASTAKA